MGMSFLFLEWSESKVRIDQQFAEYLLENGIAAKTIESYVGDVKMFIEYLLDKGVSRGGRLKEVLHHQL
jgi:site-specific recombinase XerD